MAIFTMDDGLSGKTTVTNKNSISFVDPAVATAQAKSAGYISSANTGLNTTTGNMNTSSNIVGNVGGTTINTNTGIYNNDVRIDNDLKSMNLTSTNNSSATFVDPALATAQAKSAGYISSANTGLNTTTRNINTSGSIGIVDRAVDNAKAKVDNYIGSSNTGLNGTSGNTNTSSNISMVDPALATTQAKEAGHIGSANTGLNSTTRNNNTSGSIGAVGRKIAHAKAAGHIGSGNTEINATPENTNTSSNIGMVDPAVAQEQAKAAGHIGSGNTEINGTSGNINPSGNISMVDPAVAQEQAKAAGHIGSENTEINGPEDIFVNNQPGNNINYTGDNNTTPPVVTSGADLSPVQLQENVADEIIDVENLPKAAADAEMIASNTTKLNSIISSLDYIDNYIKSIWADGVDSNTFKTALKEHADALREIVQVNTEFCTAISAYNNAIQAGDKGVL